MLTADCTKEISAEAVAKPLNRSILYNFVYTLCMQQWSIRTMYTGIIFKSALSGKLKEWNKIQIRIEAIKKHKKLGFTLRFSLYVYIM